MAMVPIHVHFQYDCLARNLFPLSAASFPWPVLASRIDSFANIYTNALSVKPMHPIWMQWWTQMQMSLLINNPKNDEVSHVAKIHSIRFNFNNKNVPGLSSEEVVGSDNSSGSSSSTSSLSVALRLVLGCSSSGGMKSSLALGDVDASWIYDKKCISMTMCTDKAFAKKNLRKTNWQQRAKKISLKIWWNSIWRKMKLKIKWKCTSIRYETSNWTVK